MVINTNEQATRIHGVYNRNNNAMNAAMTRVATAQKINSAKDGASVYAISERMRGQIRANDQANQNTQNDSALLKTAQGGISNTISILNTLRERAINAANDSNLNTNRSDIATEVQQLVQQIDDNANKVKFNGRTLLNGAVDSTVGKLNGVTLNQTGATASDNPTASSTHAVYNLTGLTQYGGTVDGDTTLVKLTKSNATSANETLFQVGDKITFNWKENGVAKTANLTVSSSTAVSDLSGLLDASGNVKAGWLAAADQVKSEDTTTNDDSGMDLVLNAVGFEKLTAKDAGGAGVYAVGKKGVQLTDFSVSVTYTGAKGEQLNRTDAQEALKLNGVQQSYAYEKTGSNSVLSTNLYNGEDNKGVSGDNSTAFKDLVKRSGGAGSAWEGTALAHVTFEVTTNKGKISFAMSGSESINDLNDKFKAAGLDVQASFLNKNDTVKYGSDAVTNGTGDNATTLKATSSGLFFVGGDGVDIQSVEIKSAKADGSAYKNSADSFAKDQAASNSLVTIQQRADAQEVNSPSATLTFFVGGEQNFGIDVTINKMTSKELLRSDVNTFSEKFLTKEGAQSALETIDTALNRALNEQTKLGAMEARLGYTSDNLTTMNENLEASDSVMRDADLAKEMTNYMKYSVLSQAAQYMLAQSGQNAFSVLNLLQQ